MQHQHAACRILSYAASHHSALLAELCSTVHSFALTSTCPVYNIVGALKAQVIPARRGPSLLHEVLNQLCKQCDTTGLTAVVKPGPILVLSGKDTAWHNTERFLEVVGRQHDGVRCLHGTAVLSAGSA